MSTKVKGGSIKEGSIPLSALNSDMNIPSYIDFVKKLSNEDVTTPLSIPYVNKVVLVSDNDIRILNLEESTVYSNYGMEFTFTALSNGATLELHIEGRGSLNAFDIKVYKDINKIKTEFLPDTVVKTTPQELSDTDKNQVLANLGIADLLEALKPVQLSDFPPVGNVTQEQLDEIGLTEKVINNILNGYTNRIYFNNSAYIVMFTSNNDESKEIIFGSFIFENGSVNAYTQYTYSKVLGEITIEIEDF